VAAVYLPREPPISRKSTSLALLNTNSCISEQGPITIGSFGAVLVNLGFCF